MTFIAGFIVGIIATYAVSILAACIYAAVLYGRRVEAERADVPTPYDEVA